MQSYDHVICRWLEDGGCPPSTSHCRQRGHRGWMGPTSSTLDHFPDTSLAQGGQRPCGCPGDE